MRYTIILIFTLLVTNSSLAQVFPSELWHEGKMILANEEILKGKIKYDLQKDIVQVDTGEKIYTYSAKSIFYFEIFDSTVDSQREFYVLPYGLVSNYKTPVIFEVLVEGNITLLSREHITTKNVQSPYYYGSYQKEVLVYEYYFLDTEGNITRYHMKRKDLMSILSKRQKQVSEYMRANRLDHDKRNDLVRIIAFYNALI
ncbi:MAG: hypothetical protein ABFS32_11170 [Bacteroidota bacterium]